MEAITTATLTLINAQDAYRQHVENNGVDPGDSAYQQVLAQRNSAAADYETKLGEFVDARP